MAISNFVMTLAVVGAMYVMVRGDVGKSSQVLRRNLKHIRTWLEEDLPQQSSAVKNIEVKPRQIDANLSERAGAAAAHEQPQSQTQQQPQQQPQQQQQREQQF